MSDNTSRDYDQAADDQRQIDAEIRQSGQQPQGRPLYTAHAQLRATQLRVTAETICRTSTQARLAAQKTRRESEALIGDSKVLRRDAKNARAAAASLKVQ